MIRVIGFDQGRKSNRIYDKGKVIAYSDTNKYPQSRIHTDAKSLPGNSGGAVVDDNGNLVGILASGDGNINEIIPIFRINKITCIRCKFSQSIKSYNFRLYFDF